KLRVFLRALCGTCFGSQAAGGFAAMRRFRTLFLFTVSLLLLMSPMATRPATAQTRVGVQGGLSLDPDQVYVGGHLWTAPLVDRLRFRPNVEAGFGEGRRPQMHSH